MINRFMQTVVSLFIMTACNNAVATDAPETQPKTKSVTRAECLAISIKEEKISCFKKLSEQRKTKLDKTNKQIEAIKRESEKVQKENEALLKEFEKGVLDKD